MKKFILPAIAALLFSGVANAQVSQKKPATPVTASISKPAVAGKSMNKTTSVAPVKTTKPVAVNKTTAIRRKHHYKTRKPKAKQ